MIVTSRFRPAHRLLRRLSVCSLVLLGAGWAAKAAPGEPPHSAELDRMIIEQAKKNGVPEKLVRRIVMRESKYDPRARNRLYWGLMQISYPTAKSMGFKGTPEELLNPLVNLTYAVPYLANAFVIAGKQEDEAVKLYAAGYYYTARARGLLGVLRTADSEPARGFVGAPDPIVDAAIPPRPAGVYGTFSQSQQLAAASPAPSAMDRAAEASQVDLVRAKTGEMLPPKKWLRDGGVSQVARGDQGLENVVAFAGAKGGSTDDKPSRKTARHSRKATEFASIDMPTNAQAYASAGGGDPRFAEAASQAAIAQATQPSAFAAQPQPVSPEGAQATIQAAAQVATAEPSAATATVGDAPTKKSRHARKSQHHGKDDGESEVARSSDGAPAISPDATDATRTDAPADHVSDRKPTRRHTAHRKAVSDAPAVAAAEQTGDTTDLRR